MKIKVGDKVRYIGGNHEKVRMIFPEDGTVGVVTGMLKYRMFRVQWPKGSTSGKGKWVVCEERVERVEEDDKFKG